MTLRCYGWPRSDARVAGYISTLAELGSGPLEAWAQDYASGGNADRIGWDLDYLMSRHRPGSCLNVGGAPYIFEYLMHASHPDVAVTTLDLEPERFPNAQARLGFSQRKLNIETAAPDDIASLGRFDSVVFTEVFEHMRIDLLGTLSRLREALTDTGVLYLSTPNGLRLSSWTQAYMKGATGPDPVEEWSKLSRLGHMGHVREYSMREVCAVLSHCGYTVIDAFYRFGQRRPVSPNARFRNMVQTAITTVAPATANNLVVVARR